MKCYIVSLRLFGPGQIMAPFRLQREREALIAKKIRLEAQLLDLPAQINDLGTQATKLLEEFKQLPIKEVM